jgi:hypothetical protein
MWSYSTDSLNTLSYSIIKVDSNKIKERNNINYYNSVCGVE